MSRRAPQQEGRFPDDPGQDSQQRNPQEVAEDHHQEHAAPGWIRISPIEKSHFSLTSNTSLVSESCDAGSSSEEDEFFSLFVLHCGEIGTHSPE